MELQPVQPLAYFSEFREVFAHLARNPSFVLKPKSTFLARDPLYFTLFLLLVFIGYTYFRTKKSNNLSWVDRLWSVMPPLYAGALLAHAWWHHSSEGRFPQRLGLLFLLQLGWGARLTYNLATKGGYKPAYEDYRWETMRTWFVGRPLRFELFVLGVNVVLTNAAVWCFSVLPSYVVYKGSVGKGAVGQSLFDLAVVFVYCFFFVVLTIADYQMFEFQKFKKHTILSRKFSNIDKRFSQGFFQEGMYSYSRHPNYFGELGLWFSIYLLSCVVAPLNWSIVGWFVLCAVFWYSIGLTEQLSSFKYPPYKYYAKKTNCLIPWFPSSNGKEKKKSK